MEVRVCDNNGSWIELNFNTFQHVGIITPWWRLWAETHLKSCCILFFYWPPRVAEYFTCSVFSFHELVLKGAYLFIITLGWTVDSTGLTFDTEAGCSYIITTVCSHHAFIHPLVGHLGISQQQGYIHIILVPGWLSKFKSKGWGIYMFMVFQQKCITSHPLPGHRQDGHVLNSFDNTLQQWLLTINPMVFFFALQFDKCCK